MEKRRTVPASVKRNRLIVFYNKGAITNHELCTRLLEELTPDNRDEFLKNIPEVIMTSLKERVKTSPRSDEEWATLRTFCIKCVANWTPDYQKRADEEEKENRKKYRQGVETLRNYFGEI